VRLLVFVSDSDSVVASSCSLKGCAIGEGSLLQVKDIFVAVEFGRVFRAFSSVVRQMPG
jgi:hypothetical protein